ncbi:MULTISPECIES: chorismate-binding protein [Rhizobium]|uniref:Chorismate-binding protein n=1 Tax=Rhizobium aouanii TaxID=3118145 RepID=A0ABU8CJH1_9HYPH|nr:chorismate-binding protein [Rhizobium acaciae]MCW1410814.1 chorismate-binding protein [Rhizobium acaciae]MCW1742887.1 chorismate-binding protein [Rhizobium acaciae]MCW1750083.1 chorismate-binding protein [Rhizobium acaciae]
MPGIQPVHFPNLISVAEDIDYDASYHDFVKNLDRDEGGIFYCNYASDIYRRKALAFSKPAIRIDSSSEGMRVIARGSIGTALYQDFVGPILQSLPAHDPSFDVPLQPFLNGLLRCGVSDSLNDGDLLGLYGAFGFDIALDVHRIGKLKPRGARHRDAILYFPTTFLEFDPEARSARRVSFLLADAQQTNEEKIHIHKFGSSAKPSRRGSPEPFSPLTDHTDSVARVKEHIGKGDVFEIVMSKRFSRPMTELPSAIFERICRKRPAPYSFFLNLGSSEYLLATSPEMLVRVRAQEVEARPIAGSIARGKTAVEDEARVRTLLNSDKIRAELMMCCDVARNDLSKVCTPESVTLRANRQIELYSNVIHTVDYITGTLAPGCTSVDALFAHMWSVALTGAPKAKALELIERYEPVPRNWYGGAVGYVRLNGEIDTGIPIAMMHIIHGTSHIQAGSSITWDSVPSEEVAEANNKISFFANDAPNPSQVRFGKRKATVLLIDFDDSFTYLTAGLLSQLVDDVEVVNYRDAIDALNRFSGDALVLSAGPGHPAEYPFDEILKHCEVEMVPTLGICLGFQGIVQHFGGIVDRLSEPVHGKHAELRLKTPTALYRSVSGCLRVGRYHSLCTSLGSLPSDLHVTATTDDEIIMSVEHQSLPIYGVQYHPESIMSADGNIGHTIVKNFIDIAVQYEVPRHEPRSL